MIVVIIRQRRGFEIQYQIESLERKKEKERQREKIRKKKKHERQCI